jgi:hypothetical protein
LDQRVVDVLFGTNLQHAEVGLGGQVRLDDAEENVGLAGVPDEGVADPSEIFGCRVLLQGEVVEHLLVDAAVGLDAVLWTLGNVA